MAGSVTNDLLYEILKQIQGDMALVKAAQAEHTQMLLRIREDINGLRADSLRVERIQVEAELRPDRIEKRLNLVDA
jgi:hypothetical protein